MIGLIVLLVAVSFSVGVLFGAALSACSPNRADLSSASGMSPRSSTHHLLERRNALWMRHGFFAPAKVDKRRSAQARQSASSVVTERASSVEWKPRLPQV